MATLPTFGPCSAGRGWTSCLHDHQKTKSEMHRGSVRASLEKTCQRLQAPRVEQNFCKSDETYQDTFKILLWVKVGFSTKIHKTITENNLKVKQLVMKQLNRALSVIYDGTLQTLVSVFYCPADVSSVIDLKLTECSFQRGPKVI